MLRLRFHRRERSDVHDNVPADGNPATQASLMFRGGVPRGIPVLLLCCFLVVGCIIALGLRSIGYLNPELDFYMIYVPVARHILSGDLPIDPFKGPGYEAALVAAHALFGEFFRSGMLLSVASAGIFLMALYETIKRTFDADTALVVSLGTALNRVFLTMATAVGTDMFFAMLAMSVVYCMVRVQIPTRRALFVAGLLAGYMYLTRYNGIAIILAAATGLLWLSERSRPWKQRIIDVAAFIVGTAVLVIPFALYTHHLTGQLFYNLNYLNVAYEIYARQTVFWNDYWTYIAPYFHSYGDVVAYNPTTFFMRLGANTASYAWKDLSSLVILPIGILAVGGLVIELRRGFSLKQAMVYLSGALMFLVLVPVFYEDRFSLFLVPVLVLPAVRFLQWIGGRVLRGWNWRLVAQILAIGLVTWCVVLDVNAVKSTVDGEPREILRTREAFVRLSGEDRRGSNVAARKPQIAYYLNLNFGDWPQASNVAEFIAGLQRNRTSFLFFRQIDIKLCPELSELLDPTQTHKGLRPLVVVDSPRCILYKVEH